jgi:hypothetical protein
LLGRLLLLINIESRKIIICEKGSFYMQHGENMESVYFTNNAELLFVMIVFAIDSLISVEK